MEHNEIFKVKNLVQEIFSEELVKKYGSGYLRIIAIAINDPLFQCYSRLRRRFRMYLTARTLTPVVMRYPSSFQVPNAS